MILKHLSTLTSPESSCVKDTDLMKMPTQSPTPNDAQMIRLLAIKIRADRSTVSRITSHAHGPL